MINVRGFCAFNRRLIITATAFIMGFTLMHQTGFSQEEKDKASGFQHISMNVESPHFSWLAPYGGPSVKVLFVCQRRHGRDVVELVQRWPVKYRTAMFGGWRQKPNKTTTGEPDYNAWMDASVQPEINEKTASYFNARFNEFMSESPQVLVIDYFTWKMLGAPERKTVWDNVKQGMGLVVTKARREFLTEIRKKSFKRIKLNIPELPIPELRKMTTITKCLGKGRIAVVRYPSPWGVRYLVPRNSNRRIFELSCAKIAKIIQWASQQLPAAEITGIAAPGKRQWKKTGPGTLKLKLKEPKSDSYNLLLTMFDQDWTELGKKTIPLESGKTELKIDIPPVPAGTDIAVVQLSSESGIDDFAAVNVNIAATAVLKLAPVEKIVAPDRDPVAAISLKNVKPGDLLKVELCDFFGNVAAKVETAARDGKNEFSLSGGKPLSRLQFIKASLLRDGKPVVCVQTDVIRTLPYDPAKFRLYCWQQVPKSFFHRCRIGHMREMGLNANYTAGSGSKYVRDALWQNVDLATNTHTSPRKSGKDQLEKLASPEYLAENVKKMLDYMKQSDELGGQWVWTHGDELYIRGWSPEVRDVSKGPNRTAFISYLEKSYGGDIKALNKAWGTSFESFAKLVPPKNIEVPREPRAPWLDYCRFLTNTFCTYFKKINEAVLKKHPKAIVSIDGIEQFSCFDGIDWYRLQRSQNGIVIYPHDEHDNKLYSWRSGLSFMPKYGFNGYWLAYASEMTPDIAGSYPWRALFAGLGSIGFFQAYETNDIYSALYPDWNPRPTYKQVTENVSKISKGYDKLLLDSDRQWSPIGIHYSIRSWDLSFPSAKILHHVNQMGTYSHTRIYRPGYGGHVANTASGFIAMLLDIGYQPRMVATPQIEAGELSKYKVFIMPFSQSLTEAEEKEIRKFVKNGGVVIADYGTGLRDGRGNLRKDGGGSLDDIFGIRQQRGPLKEQPAIISDRISVKGKGFAWSFVKLNDLLTGPNFKLREDASSFQPGRAVFNLKGITHGDAKDGTKLFAVNPYGKGVAVYLNFSMESYLLMRSLDTGFRLKRFMQQFISQIGHVSLPACCLTAQSGFREFEAGFNLPDYNVEISKFVDGNAEYTGMAWNWKRLDWGTRKITAKFITPAHLYDSIGGKYLGYTDHSTFAITGGSPVKLFARLPYKVDSLKVSPESATLKPGTPAAFEVEVVPAGKKSPARHIIRVTVRDTAGKEISCLGESLTAQKGKASWTWRPMYNLPRGKYRASFKDVATGMEKSVDVEVK